MINNILALLMSDIPSTVIELNNAFSDGVFNIGKTKRLIPGYVVDENENPILPKTLCHDENYLLYLCRGEVDPSSTVQSIIDSSQEIKVSDYLQMKSDINSEWYIKPAGNI